MYTHLNEMYKKIKGTQILQQLNLKKIKSEKMVVHKFHQTPVASVNRQEFSLDVIVGRRGRKLHNFAIFILLLLKICTSTKIQYLKSKEKLLQKLLVLMEK